MSKGDAVYSFHTCLHVFQKILEEINNADTGAPCSQQHLKKVAGILAFVCVGWLLSYLILWQPDLTFGFFFFAKHVIVGCLFK